MADEARDLLEICLTLEKHSEEAQQRMMQFLVSKFGVMPALAREYERMRKAGQRVPDYVPDTVPEDVPDIVPDNWRDTASTNGSGPPHTPPYANGQVSKARSVRKKQSIDQPALDKAKSLIEAKDYEFLLLCPEPFKTQWLVDPDWWLSIRDGYPKIDAQREASRCMSFVQSRFSAAQIERLNLRERFRRWVAKADMWRQNREERQAVRR